MKLQDQRVPVTGATAGIGQETAKLFARCGARVVDHRARHRTRPPGWRCGGAPGSPGGHSITTVIACASAGRNGGVTPQHIPSTSPVVADRGAASLPRS